MKMREIPSSGKSLPVIGCGTWLGFDVAGSPGDPPQRGEVLQALFDAGGSVIDSSPMYGSAEAVVGELLDSKSLRDKAFIATKVWTSGRGVGIEQMERSMQLLRTPFIDLMQVHNLVDWKAHLPTLRKWKDQGRIGYIGVTHYTASGYADLEQVMRNEPLDFVQFNYSIARREAEPKLLPLAREKGIAVLINLPFGGGKALAAVVEKALPPWAEEIGCTSWNQLLLKFVLSQPAVTCVIPGTSNPQHMADNAKAGEGLIPEPGWWKDKIAALGV